MHPWLHEFRAFSAFHTVMAAGCVALIALWCVLGRWLACLDRTDLRRREPVFATWIGWAIVAWQVFATVWRVLPAQWDLNESLPMHLCRWNGWVVAVCLIGGRRDGWRWSRALTFFWGLGLSVQGIVTPMWTDGAATVAFWLYWVGHTQIIGAAVYDLAVRAYEPTKRDLRLAMGAGVAYAALTAGLNRALGTNYSYLGAWDYGRRSVVDRLGDYPWRILAMVGGALVLFIAMYWVSRGARALAARRRGATL